jgi:stage II sporulation protein D
MKLLCLLLLFPLAAHAAAMDGARSLTIRVWSTRTIRALTVTPVHGAPSAKPLSLRWKPAGFTQQSLSGNYRLDTPDGASVTAAGAWTIAGQRDGLRVLLTLPSERYVAAALNGEAAADEPLASLKAMAITIRTFALTNANRHAVEGFNLCDNTHCQALRLGIARPAVEQAVRETAGETLWFHGRRATVYYTQHCGGESESAGAVWPESRAPYLKGEKADPYCLRRSPAAWQADLALDRLSEILRAQGWHTPSPIASIRVIARTSGGRAERLIVSGRGAPAMLSASSFRFAVDRALGWNQLRSDWFTASVDGPTLHIAGKGYGHGVGLCQAGAYEMASEGRSEGEILDFYFPSLTVANLPGGQPWRMHAGAGWALLTTGAAEPLLQAGNAAWAQAQARFGGGGAPMHPTVQALPSTELFRQTTHQPGWMLASTSRDLVFLQPAAVRRGPAEPLLLHEFLHVLIEAQSGDTTPLWLREGLAETLAEPEQGAVIDMTVSEVDAALAYPGSEVVSRHAHRVAGSMAAQLCARYGLPAVRGFLRTGLVR